MIYLIGINHKTSDLETREKIWLSDQEIRRILPVLHQEFYEECFMVSTCNRTELYGVPAIPPDLSSPEEFLKTIESRLIHEKDPALNIPREKFFHLKDLEAVRHLLEVATGLDSLVVGDVQILNQVRQHYDLATELRSNGSIMNKMLHVAIHAGKRTKTETDISRGAVSVSYAAVELASKIYFNLEEKKALLIGAGETGELTARHLTSRGIGRLYITNRTFEKAQELATHLNAHAFPLEELDHVLSGIDILITSVSSKEYIITRKHVEGVMARRKRTPLLIIDIGVPRNVDPSLNQIENIFLHDLDTLSRVVEQSLQKRKSCIPEVERIISEELEEFNRWYQSYSVAPLVDELKDLYETIRKEELGQHIHKFSDDDKKWAEHVTRRIIHRLVQMPASELRNGKADKKEHKEQKIRMLRQIFGLNASLKNETHPYRED
jgi:glutamyl-tRNA reductase